MDQIADAHYFMLSTQGNLYSLATLNLCSGINKFLMASLKRKILAFEFCESAEGVLKPTVKELACTYIPSGAEIISINAFNKSNVRDDFQIGIAIAKPNTEGSPETYLNIYAEEDIDNNYSLNIDSIAQNCLMIELKFIPYQLTHTFVVDHSTDLVSKEVVWLLSGSDCKVHVFQEDHQNHSYNEADIAELFPELTNLPSIAIWIHVYYTQNFTRRLSAVGCECGTVQLSQVDARSNTVISTDTDIFDGPISQVTIFSLCTEDDISPPDCIRKKEKAAEDSTSESNSKIGLHLLVCNTLEESAVYMDIDEDGLLNRHDLRKSDLHDACLCACVADINMDGCSEILLGTYGQRILMYRWSGSRWEKSGQRSTANPVHSLHYVDLTGDGVNELVVQTLSGVHIMQHKPEKIQQMFLSKLKKALGKEEKPSELLEPEQEEECPCEEAREHSDN